MTGNNHDRERSPQQSQRPGSAGARRSVFGSSSNIFGHRSNPIQPVKSPADIKNSAPSISEVTGSEKEKDEVAKVSRNLEGDIGSSRKEIPNEKAGSTEHSTTTHSKKLS